MILKKKKLMATAAASRWRLLINKSSVWTGIDMLVVAHAPSDLYRPTAETKGLSTGPPGNTKKCLAVNESLAIKYSG